AIHGANGPAYPPHPAADRFLLLLVPTVGRHAGYRGMIDHEKSPPESGGLFSIVGVRSLSSGEGL
ncbi:hypothetical protein O0J72_00955, partial [Stenotrophomonas sp. Sm3212]|uniref:hypothetical protein n=1 Tax=Stenotrophomonas sp. Sm3212 TaxID=3002748 RepID=UPI0027E3B7CD